MKQVWKALEFVLTPFYWLDSFREKYGAVIELVVITFILIAFGREIIVWVAHQMLRFMGGAS